MRSERKIKNNRLKLFLPATLLLLVFSCISRMQRPILKGTILDYDGNPVANCSVGETVTDKFGKYTLPEIRYNAFLLAEILTMEAGPVFIEEKISKKDFETDFVVGFNRYGTGTRKGTTWDMDTVFLKREKENFSKMLKGQFDIYTTQKNDTLILKKKKK